MDPFFYFEKSKNYIFVFYLAFEKGTKFGAKIVKFILLLYIVCPTKK